MSQIEKVCILDYGSGNVGSIFNLLKYLEINSVVSNKKKDIQNSSHLILPGVGSFESAMKKITQNLPIEYIENEVVSKGKPFLGICIGMQVLAEYGLEFGKNNGLGWIKGSVIEIESGNQPLPHIGWNNVDFIQKPKLVSGLDKVNDFYFVNSYCFKLEENNNLIGETTYHEKFASIIGKDNILGVQFHPEKSQAAGQKLITNFLEYK